MNATKLLKALFETKLDCYFFLSKTANDGSIWGITNIDCKNEFIGMIFAVFSACCPVFRIGCTTR